MISLRSQCDTAAARARRDHPVLAARIGRDAMGTLSIAENPRHNVRSCFRCENSTCVSRPDDHGEANVNALAARA